MLKILSTITGLLITVTLFARETVDRPGLVRLTSEQEPGIYQKVWAEWRRFGEDWVYVSLWPNEGSNTVRYWDQDGSFETILTTSAREGISYISALTTHPDGRFAIRGLLKPVVYTFFPDKPEKGFTQFVPAMDLTGSMVFWDEDTLIGATQMLAFKTYSGKNPKLIKALNSRLPDMRHPSMGRVNTQRMIFAKHQNRLAIGYVLGNQFATLTVRGDKVQSHKVRPVRFRGYIEPPEEY
jgi:hypothetical protein